jgi:hypothetical protein
VVVLHCLHFRSSEENFGASAVAHLADSLQGPPDAHATVQYQTPKSKVMTRVVVAPPPKHRTAVARWASI